MTYAAPTPEEIAARRAQLAPFDGWNERAFAALIAWRGVPQSYLDMGSGTGAMVNLARRMGIEAFGVDVINGPEHWFIDFDLNYPLLIHDTTRPEHVVWSIDLRDGEVDIPPDDEPPPKLFSLITCLEVAEHLPEDAAPVLCDTIARHLAPGGLLVFSAAPPGQRGEHHVNTKPAHYWKSLFYERQISYRDDYTRELAMIWTLTTGPCSHWLASNVMIYDTWDGKVP